MHIEFSGTNHDHLPRISKLIWKKTEKAYWQYIIVMSIMGGCMLAIVLFDSDRQSFWNGLSSIGLALVCIAAIFMRLLYSSKKKYFERGQKYVEHKNSLGKDWKVLIADDHLATSDGEHDLECLWSCFDTYMILDESILIKASTGSLTILVPKEKVSEEQRKELLAFCKEHLTLT